MSLATQSDLHAHDQSPPECSRRQTPSFLSLPREIRDEIYGHLFDADPYWRSSFHGLPLDLHYGTRCCPVSYSPRASKEWLLASKAIMHEALEEYARKAEWTWLGPSISNEEPRWVSSHTEQPGSFPLPVDSDKVRRMELYVGNLAHWETPHRNEGQDGRANLAHITDVARSVGVKFDTVRLQGHTHRSGTAQLPYDGQPHHMFANLRKVFKGIDVRRWEFEIVGGRLESSEVVFELDKDGGLVLVVDERWSYSNAGKGIPREHTSLCKLSTKQKMERLRKETEAQRSRKEKKRKINLAREKAHKQKEARKAEKKLKKETETECGESKADVGHGGASNAAQESTDKRLPDAMM